jgi:hypothetical protein
MKKRFGFRVVKAKELRHLFENLLIIILIKQIYIKEKLLEDTYFNFFRVALQHNETTLKRIKNENKKKI